MNSDRLNRWLTLFANIGVIVGLFLLILELNQNSDLLRAQIHQSRADTHVDHRLEDVESSILTPIRMKLQEHGFPRELDASDALNAEELFRFRDYLAALHTDFDNLYYQYQEGYLDDEYYQYRVVCAIRRNAPYWKKHKIFQTNVRPSFSAEIERILRDVDWC